MWLSIIALLLVHLGVAICQDPRPGWQPRFLGNTTIGYAAYVEVYCSEDTSLDIADRWTMYVSTFDSLALRKTDPVFYMRSPGKYLDSVPTWNQDHILQLDDSAYWPNTPIYMPSSVVGVEGILQTSGFLVPTKKDGQLQIYDTTVEPPSGPVNIAENDSNSWTYHRVKWQDMNLDGYLDAVTARFHLPNIGDVVHEFMYFENPGTGVVPAWPERVISTTGPDIYFDRVVLSTGGRDYDCYIFPEFFNERITIYWTESEVADWSDTSQVFSRVINPNAGQPFDVLVDDFNRDGTLELLSSEYNTTSGVGLSRVYFFPNDFRTDDFDSVIIANDFVPNNALQGEYMSPGSMKTFYPSVPYEEEIADDGLPHKPWILLSGDDDGRMYILYPDTENRTDWTYQKHILVDTFATTMGEMALGDVDGDGYTELFVNGYTVDQLYVYTYAP